jgi:hypothetical protein
VLGRASSPVVCGLDEIDRLFSRSFASEVFGLFRSWHNKRALEPAGPWRNLTLAIAYATEAHLFITDVNQSPFNVGTRFELEDFTIGQVAELNDRYGAPLANASQLQSFFDLVGGHPYLSHRGIYEMAERAIRLKDLLESAASDRGPFGDHLRRLTLSLSKDSRLSAVVREVLEGRQCPDADTFYRLRSAGILVGETARAARPRCRLYAAYLRDHLGGGGHGE